MLHDSAIYLGGQVEIPERLPPPVQFAKIAPSMKDEERWRQLHEDTGNIVNWPPIALKALYVLGIIHDTCESVNWLLRFPNTTSPQPWPVTYLPAVGLCLTSLELLGRCLLGYAGYDGNHGKNLESGIAYLFSVTPRNETPGVLAVTQYGMYSLDDLVALRHFAAHGQATVNPKRPFRMIDVELLDAFPQLIGNALDRYWNTLQSEESACEVLAQANVLPLRITPILKMLRLFEYDPIASKYHSISDIFNRFDWKVQT
jgi:hypothetical protein